MKAERWQQIDKLFQAAQQREPGERAAFVEEACAGDQTLRKEVESLLASDEGAESFIESPPYELAAELMACQSMESGGSLLGPGEHLLHYRIIEKLGQGGMGEVYLAQDTKLDRKVAIKLLRPGLTSASLADERANNKLIREAQAAAKLDHPGICPVHEVGIYETNGFIVMQYIEGETLAARIKRGPLETGQALDLAVQVADALAEAHSQGVIHRDIKPQNIMVNSRGQVKVLDFGLARITRQSDTRKLDGEPDSLASTPGTILGTVPYMSPEQLRGEPVDGRTDIFSFGTVLYEMLSGVQPFASDSSADTIAAILTLEPPLLREHAVQIPEGLEQVVTKCLSKDRSQRYQTMLEVATELDRLHHKLGPADNQALPTRGIARRLNTEATNRGPKPDGLLADHRSITVAVAMLVLIGVVGYELVVRKVRSNAKPFGAPIGSIAVLPFKTLSQDEGNEYFELGLADALIAKLSGLRQMIVRPTSAVRKYTDLQQDPVAAGRELKVEVVLEGSMQKSGDRVRVTARLVRVDDGGALWSEQFDESIKDVLILEDAISERVATALTPTLTGSEKKLLAKHYTDNQDAYSAYLMGRYNWNKRTYEGLNKGIQYFQQAIKIEPDYALAHAGLADCYISLYDRAYSAAEDSVPLAKASAARALELDDTLAEAHTSRAYILWVYDKDWAGAQSEFLKAIDLNPNYATARHWYARWLESLGRFEEALVEIRRAQEIDPLSLIINTSIGELFYFSRDYDKAIEQFRKTLDIQPDFVQAYWQLGNAYERKQMYEQSVAAYRRAIELSGQEKVAAAFEKSYLVSGYRAAMRTLCGEWKKQAREQPSLSHTIAKYSATIGDKGQAFEWLEKAYQARHPWLINLEVEPQMDGLRSDPRFVDLLRRLRFPQS